MSIKGLPSQLQIKKPIVNVDDMKAIPRMEFVTVQPRGSDRLSLDTQSHGFYKVSQENEISLITSRIIGKASHGARVGDIIKFTSGLYEDVELTITGIIDADKMVIGTEFTGTLPSIGDEYSLLRPVSMLLTKDGAVPVTVSDMALEATQLLVLAQLEEINENSERLTSIGYGYVDFSTSPHTGGSYATLFIVPDGLKAYKARIVQNGGNDIKFSINGGVSASGVIPAGEKGDIDIIIEDGDTFKIDSLSGGNITSGKLFINFFGV